MAGQSQPPGPTFTSSTLHRERPLDGKQPKGNPVESIRPSKRRLLLQQEIVKRSLLFEYQDLRERLSGAIDPLDGYGHPVTVMGKYSATVGSVRVSGVHSLVRGGVGIDLLYCDGLKWGVAGDRDFHAVAFGTVARVEGYVSGQRAVRRLCNAAAR